MGRLKLDVVVADKRNGRYGHNPKRRSYDHQHFLVKEMLHIEHTIVVVVRSFAILIIARYLRDKWDTMFVGHLCYING